MYAGGASPINFNGLVRQYYLRKGANVGDIQVNLVDKKMRDRQSHEIAFALRQPLSVIAKKYNANVKVVEVPPGPPVIYEELYNNRLAPPVCLKNASFLRHFPEESCTVSPFFTFWS